jgi:hypothetical protein
MLDLVLAALGTARLADFRADSADFLHEPRSTAHISRGRPANFGTILIQPNALGHLLDILFAQASIGAMLAFLGTADAGFDAGLMFLVAHGILP